MPRHYIYVYISIHAKKTPLYVWLSGAFGYIGLDTSEAYYRTLQHIQEKQYHDLDIKLYFVLRSLRLWYMNQGLTHTMHNSDYICFHREAILTTKHFYIYVKKIIKIYYVHKIGILSLIIFVSFKASYVMSVCTYIYY
jgi:hypothetical protein